MCNAPYRSRTAPAFRHTPALPAMCGRTACTLAPDEVSRASRYTDRSGTRRRPRWRDGDGDKYRPSYNKSPQSLSPVLLSQRHFDKNAPVDECVLAAMRWGLIPAWFRENDPGKMKYSTSNCRSDGLLERKSYKDPLLRGQRCVILADGFYEWKRQEKDKQPFFIYFPQTEGASVERAEGQEEVGLHEENSEDREGDDWTGWRLLTIAGLFDCWKPPGGEDPLYTYSVITVDAAQNLKGIHDRMPAVLDGEDEVRRWLDFGEVKSSDALKLLQPKNILTSHPVSSLVNNSRNNSPECLQPVDLECKKEAKPTGSSKVMMSWLKSCTPSKRDEAQAEPQGKAEKRTPAPGPLEMWLQGSNKKPRTK